MSMLRRILGGPRAPRPIGIVLWKGGENRAELWGRNQWVVYRGEIRDDRFARTLRDDYADRLVHRGPSDGYYGPAVLDDLAKRMGGTAKFYKPVRLARGDKP